MKMMDCSKASKRIRDVVVRIAAVAAMTAAMTAAAYEYAPIDNSTAPGTVLSSGFYQVNGSAKINAKDDPGQSALRVAPGATVTIDIPFGSALTVIGGPAEGMIGAGAGIEVPPDAKLLVTGYGFLYAQGGAGGAGGAGHSGEDGDLMAVFDIHEEGQPRSDADKPLIYASTGAGGKGGNGGGGAGAGIGGRGGRGGVGGKGGVSRVAIRKSRWEGNEAIFSEWLQLLDHKDEDKYLYNIDEYELGADGRPGSEGSAGHAGGNCGEIVIGEGVQVLALPGLPGASGAGGPYGTAFHGPDFEFEDVDEDKMFYKGLEIAYKTYEAYEKSQSTNETESSSWGGEEDEKEEARKQMLWAFGGGGGGGGAGGAAPTSGIGPGGAGGGGGGGAGGGLFAFGANAWPSDEEKDEFDMNGGGGMGGQGVFVASLDEGLDLTTHGEAGRESEHVNYNDDNENFNYITNRQAALPDYVDLNRLFTWSISRKMSQESLPTKYYQAGLGAKGGAVGTVKTLGERKFLVSKNATILSGLEPENQKEFEGEVIIEVMLGDQLTEVPCGPIVSPVPVPDAEGGKFFMGYFTGENGTGEQYYDCLGLPVGKHELWGKLQLYPHFVDAKPDDVHKVEFRYFKEGDTTGEQLAWIWVQKGKPLPHIGSQKLGTIRGWRPIGAYLPVGEEEDWWYDEDGTPVKEDGAGNPYLYDRDDDTVLRLEVEPKWEAMAEMPEDLAYYTYTGGGISGVELDSDEYEIVGGTSVATNVGKYVTTIRTKAGYELWDDFLEHPETATNWERTVHWTIVKADLDMLSLPNQVYNWADSNAIFQVAGKVPSGVTVNYEITKFLANGTMEIRADADGGQNFNSKSMTATWTIPELLRIEKVVSHYPWDTTVEIDVRANPSYGPSVYTNRLASKIMPVAALSTAQEYGDAGYTFFSNRTCFVAEAYRGAGTIVLDMKEALANGRDRVSLFLTIDDVPCSLPVEVAVDTTAVIEDGVPTYAITDPAQIFPINHSWRFMEPTKRNAQAVTWLEIDSDDWWLERFRPVNELGLRVNDGVVRWIPQPYENYVTDYKLMLEIDCGGGFTTNLTAKFSVAYQGEPEFPFVAYVGETGFTSLEAAWNYFNTESELEGEDRVIRIVGDVQTEAFQLPSLSGDDGGATIVYERGGVFDVTRQFDVPQDEAARYNDVHALVKYEWEESGGYIPVDPPPPTPVNPVAPTELIPAECEPGLHDFHPVALAAMPDGQNAGLMELCSKCDVARVKTVPGVSFTLPDAAELTYVVSNLTADALCTPNADGRYVVLSGLDIGIYGVAKPGYVVTGAPYEIRPVPADFELDPSQLQTATAIRYQIAYEPGAGEGVSETNSVAYDAEYTVRTVGTADGELDFFLTGHSFAGVWTNLAAETSIDAGSVISNLTTTADEFFIFEPVWTQNVYAVHYRRALDDAEGEVVTNVAYGGEFAIISNCFSETGYVFGGWARQDGVHGLYQPDEVVSNLVDSGELVLCPVWNPADYTVTYKPGDGLGEDYVQPNAYGVENTTIDAETAEMVRDHYILTGWRSEFGTGYGIGETFSNLTAEVGGNVDFTAKWTQNEFPVVIGELPEHVRVQVMQDDRSVLKEEGGYFVTNGTATVYFIALDDYLFDVEPVSDVHAVEVTVSGAATEPVQCPRLLTPAPWMGGTLAWNEGCETAQLSMAVTNGTASAVTNLIFAFEDRADGSKLLTDGGDVAPVLLKEESWFREGVTNTWRYVSVPATSDAFVAVTNGETGVVTVKFDLKKAGITPDEAAKYLGWIGWTAYGTRLYAPVCSWADEIAEFLPVSPTPVSESDIRGLAGGYFVSYDGAGAAGAMEEDLFIADMPTNLTANAYAAVGYAFAGWTTNGVDKLYDDCAEGVNFAEPGETLALKALWDDTGVTVTTFAELTNALVTATNQTAALPVRVVKPADIVFPADGCVTVYAGGNRPAVSFEGAGKFDVSGVVPQWGAPVVVGEGFTEADLALFDTKGKDVKMVYESEGGRVVLHARGETEDFPWLVGPEGSETATTMWLEGGVLYAKPVRGTAAVTALVAVTNLNGGVTAPLRAVAAGGTATNDVVMLLGDDRRAFDSLAEALAADPQPATVQFFEDPMRTVAIPEAMEGYTYAVSNETAGLTVTGEPADGTNSYKVVDGEVVKVYFTLTDGYTYVGEVTNPMDLGAITSDRTVAALPRALALMGVAAYPAAKTYDGEPTNVTYVVTNYLGEAIAGATVSLREPGGAWVAADKFADYLNVTNATVEVKAEKAGCTTATNAATVVISPRAVTLTSATETWVYDGQAHSNTAVTVTGDGFAAGEGVTTNGFPTITEVGTVPNAFSYAFLVGTEAANYSVTCVTGTLAVVGYWVSYDGAGGAGTMETDFFIPGVPTNLTANAYSAVGYAFEGWTTNGVDKLYDDRAAGTDFAEPGETLALRALWDDTGVTVRTFAELTNALVTATNQTAALPVRVIKPADIVFPADGCVTVYAGGNRPAVSFEGAGLFDVSGIVPKWGEPVVVGEGFADEDALGLFDTKGVSWPVYEAEGGRVVLHARGETEAFPWILDEENGVTAWVEPALTNLAAVVIDNGLQAETNAIDLVALTNNLAVYGYEPALPLEELNALVKIANAEGVGYVVPVEWDDADGNGYDTLADALAAGVKEVVPDFVITEETPKVIAETVKAEDGKTYSAVVRNETNDVDEPVKAIYAAGLLDLAASEKRNVTLVATAKDASKVDENTLTNTLLKALEKQENHPMRYMETRFVDLSVYFDAARQTTLGTLIAVSIPWTIESGVTYGVARMHGDPAEAQWIPERKPGATTANEFGEYFEIGAGNDEIVLHVKNFSDYLIAETLPLTPRIGASIKWKLCYATGSLFAQLKLAVTNGQASAVENLKFVFEDRADGSKLWGASANRSEMAAVLTGWTGLPAGTWRCVNVDGDALTAVKGGTTGTFGVQSGIDTANGTVAVADRKLELYKKNAVISPEEANEFLGWVVWEAYGEKHCAPVGENAPMVASVARMLRAPLSVASVNKAAAYGSAYLMDGSDPDCEIAAFTVGEGTIRGRIALKGADGKAVAPGGNVKATLYGATSLDGLFASCGTLALAADGTFATPIPAGKAFFRVKLEVVDVIK